MKKAFSVQIHSKEYTIGTNDSGERIIEAHGIFYPSVMAWLNGEHITEQNTLIPEVSKVICFFSFGPRYRVIEDSEKFAKSYNRKIERDKAFANNLEIPKTSSWGTFDTTHMQSYWHEGTLEFFAEDTLTGVPYHVTWQKGHPAKCSFHLLPAR